MPSSKLSLDFKGLVTAPGQLAAPVGSLTTAQNVNLPAPGLAEKRKGFAAFPKATFSFGSSVWSLISTKQLGAYVLANYGGGSSASYLAFGDGSASATLLPTPDGSNVTNTPQARMKCAVSLQNHYLTSSRAPLRLESNISVGVTSPGLYYAGMPRAPGIYGAVLSSGTASPWLQDGYAVNYRIVFGRYDANGNLMLSSPSGVRKVSNISTTPGYVASTTTAVALSVIVPFQADTSATSVATDWFVQVYRSEQAQVSAGPPSDELQLCYQANLTPTQITNRFLTFVDLCPELMKGAALYTNTISGGDVNTGMVAPNSTGAGLAAANDRPPLAKDVASFADCVWWANFTTLQRLQASVLSVGTGSTNLKAGDILTLGDPVSGFITYTASASPVGLSQFKVETGLGSITANTIATVQNLVSAINLDPLNTRFVAAYIGDASSFSNVGAFLIESRRSDDVAFTLTTSGSVSAFSPQDMASKQDQSANGLAFSKPLQADAVPPANYAYIGRKDTQIQRIVPLRDALFVFTDSGIYWVRGTNPSNFVVEEFDKTFRILGRDACIACQDAIYVWGHEGIAKVTNGGVEYIDLAIRNQVDEAANSYVDINTPADFAEYFSPRAWAAAYPVQRRVVFASPVRSVAAPYECPSALVYNIATGQWSTYDWGSDNGKSCGVVQYARDLLYMSEWNSAGTDVAVFYEKNSNKPADYYDATRGGLSTQDITSTLTYTSSVPNPSGLCHWQEAQIYWSNSDVYPSLTVPTSAAMALRTEFNATQSTSITGITTQQSRVMVEPAVGFAARQVFTMTHTAREYMGCSGFGLIYFTVSNFITR